LDNFLLGLDILISLVRLARSVSEGKKQNNHDNQSNTCSNNSSHKGSCATSWFLFLFLFLFLFFFFFLTFNVLLLYFCPDNFIPDEEFAFPQAYFKILIDSLTFFGRFCLEAAFQFYRARLNSMKS
jgi:hypothetical protein